MNREVSRALKVVVTSSILVGLVRVHAGRELGAVGVEADGWHTLADTMSIGLVFAGLGLVSAQVYERLEIWAARALALWMLAIAAELAIHVWDGNDAVALATGPLVALLPTMAVQIVLTRYQERVAARTGSMLLRGNTAHTRADVLSTAGVLVAAMLAGIGVPWVDKIAGIAIAFAIATSAIELLRDMDPCRTLTGPSRSR